jgi:type IV secretory pathway VirB3-like protein
VSADRAVMILGGESNFCVFSGVILILMSLFFSKYRLVFTVTVVLFFFRCTDQGVER